MNSRDMKKMKQRHRRTIYYLILMVLHILFAGLTFVFLFSLKEHSNNLTEFFGIPVLACVELLLLFLCHRKIKNDGGDKKFVEPYMARLSTADPDKILSCISSNIFLRQIDASCLYGYLYRRKYVHLFITCLPEYDKKTFNRMSQNAIRKAQKMYGLKSVMSLGEANKTVTIYLILLDSFNPAAEKASHINTAYYTPGTLKVYVDLNKQEMYFPAHCGRLNGWSANHLFCVSLLLKILDDIIVKQ